MPSVAITLMLAIFAGLGRSDEPAVKQGKPTNVQPGDKANQANQVQALPPELVAAWEKAGAMVGWISVDRFDLHFRKGAEGKKGEVRAFGFDTWTTSVVVEETQVTDVGLKDLASLKSLQVLDLWETQVTDAGLKELAVLKSLQVVQLARTKVTDAGVAELQKALPTLKIER